MKITDILVIGGIGLAAYYLIANKTGAESTYSSSSPTAAPVITQVPGTSIPASAELVKKLKDDTTTKNLSGDSLMAVVKKDLGSITVKQAATQPLSTAVASVFANYKGAVPSSVLSGKMTATDIQIAKNIAAQKNKI